MFPGRGRRRGRIEHYSFQRRYERRAVLAARRIINTPGKLSAATVDGEAANSAGGATRSTTSDHYLTSGDDMNELLSDMTRS